MAFTSSIVSVSGTGPYAIGFNYRAGETIKVSPDVSFSFVGTPTQEQPSGTAIVLDTPPATAVLTIYKEVKLDELAVDWQEGSSLDLKNLRSMSLNLMEQAQTAYDVADKADATATETLSTVTALLAEVDSVIAIATAQAEMAEYWAGVALDAGSTANPEEAAAIARDAAIAARDAALVAQALAEAARVSSTASAAGAASALANATTAKNLAQSYANASKGVQVVTGEYSAKHYAETAQDIVTAGAVKWNGSTKFVSTEEPNPALGVNGDFWFRREL